MTSKSSAYTALVVFIVSLILLSIIAPAYSGIIAQSRNNGADLRKGALSLHVYPDGRFYVKYGNGTITYAGPTTYLSVRIGNYVFTNYNGMLSLSWLQSPTRVIGNSAITVWVINNTVKIIQNLTLLDKAVLVKLKLVGGAPNIDARYVIDIVSSTSRKPLLIVGYDTQKYTNYLRDGMSISQIYTNTIIDGKPAAVGVWWDKDNTAPKKAGTAAWGVATHGGWTIPNATNTMTISTATVLYYKIPLGSEISFKVGILPDEFTAKLVEVNQTDNPFVIAFNKLYYYPGETGVVAVENKVTYNEILSTSKVGNTPSPTTADNVEITGIMIEEGANLKNAMLTHNSESLIGFAYATFKAPIFEDLANHPTQVTMLISIHSDTLGNYILKVRLNLTKNLGYVTVNNKKYYIETSTNDVENITQDPLSNIYIIDDKGRLLEPTDRVFPVVLLKIINEILPSTGIYNSSTKRKTLALLIGYRPPNMQYFFTYINNEKLYEFLEGTHDIIGKLVDEAFDALGKAMDQIKGLLSSTSTTSSAEESKEREEELLADTFSKIILDAINLKERYNPNSELSKLRVMSEFTFSTIVLLVDAFTLSSGAEELSSGAESATSITQIILKNLAELKSSKKLMTFAKTLAQSLEKAVDKKIEDLPEDVKKSIKEKAEKELIDPFKNLSKISGDITLYDLITSMYREESMRLGVLLIIKGVYTQVLAKYHEEGGSMTRNSPIYSQAKAMDMALSYVIKKLYDDTRQYRDILLLANMRYPYLIMMAEEYLVYEKISKSTNNAMNVNLESYGTIRLALSSVGISVYADLVSSEFGQSAENEDIPSVLLNAIAEASVKFCVEVVKDTAGEIIKMGIKTAVAEVLGDAAAAALGPIFFAYQVYNVLYDALGIGDMITAYKSAASMMGIASRIPDAYDAALSVAYGRDANNLDYSASLTWVALRIFKLSIEYETLDVLEDAIRVKKPIQLLLDFVRSTLGVETASEAVNELQALKDCLRNRITVLYQFAGDAFLFIAKIYNAEPIPQKVEVGEHLLTMTVELNSHGQKVTKEVRIHTFDKSYEWYTFNVKLQQASVGLVKGVNLYMIKQYWARNLITGKSNMYLASTITFKFKDGSYVIELLPSLKNNFLKNVVSAYKAYSAKGDIKFVAFKNPSFYLANVPTYSDIEERPGNTEESDTDLGWMSTGELFGGHNLPVLFVTRSLPAIVEVETTMNFIELLNKLGAAGAVLKLTDNIDFASRRLLFLIDEIKPARNYMLAGTNYDLKPLAMMKFSCPAYTTPDKIISLAKLDMARIINPDYWAPVPGLNAIRIPVLIQKSKDATYFKLGADPSALKEILLAYSRVSANTEVRAVVTLSLLKVSSNGGIVQATPRDISTSNVDQTLDSYFRVINEIREIVLGVMQRNNQLMMDLTNQLLAYYRDELISRVYNFVNNNPGEYVLGLAEEDLRYLSNNPSALFAVSNLLKQENAYVMLTVKDQDKAVDSLSDLLTLKIPADKVILSVPYISKNLLTENYDSVIDMLIRVDGMGIYATLIGLNEIGLPATSNSVPGKIIEQLISIINHRHILPTSDSYASLEPYDPDKAELSLPIQVKIGEGGLADVTVPFMFKGEDLNTPKLMVYIIGLKTSDADIKQRIELYRSYSDFLKGVKQGEYTVSIEYKKSSLFNAIKTGSSLTLKVSQPIGKEDTKSVIFQEYSQIFILVECWYVDGEYHIHIFVVPFTGGNSAIRNMLVSTYYGFDIINEYLQDKGILATTAIKISQTLQSMVEMLYNAYEFLNTIKNLIEPKMVASVDFTIPSGQVNSVLVFSGISIHGYSDDTYLGTVTQYLSAQLYESGKIGLIMNPIYVNEHYQHLPGFNAMYSAWVSVGG